MILPKILDPHRVSQESDPRSTQRVVAVAEDSFRGKETMGVIIE
jgi:hypothetical protein